MPGTIQVSVLDFVGLPSSLPPSSSISIKVSMGKREYQNWEKWDFSFPLVTLHENLIVTLYDAEGNKISHTGVETISIVEKGFWDDYFPLEGGGHVHMKLEFSLSEEDRNRIRMMRESASKKKQSELLNSSHQRPETASTISSTAVTSSLQHNHDVSDSQKNLLHIEASSNGEVASQASMVSNPASFCTDPQLGTGISEGTHLDREQRNPNDADTSEVTSSSDPSGEGITDLRIEAYSKVTKTQSPSVDGSIYAEKETTSLVECSEPVVSAKNISFTLKQEEDQAHNPEKQGPLKKTPSNVRKMISAFETSRTQDITPENKPTTTIKSQSSKVGVEAPSKEPHIKEVKTDNIKPTHLSSVRVNKLILKDDLSQIMMSYVKKREQRDSEGALDESKSSQNVGQSKEFGKKEENESIHQMRVSTAETATASGQMLDEYLTTKQASDSPSTGSGGKSAIKKSAREIHHKVTKNEETVRESAVEVASVSEQSLNEHLVRQQPSDSLKGSRRSGGNSDIKRSAREIHHKVTRSKERVSPDLMRVSTVDSGQMLDDSLSESGGSGKNSAIKTCTSQIHKKVARNEEIVSPDLMRISAVETATVSRPTHDVHLVSQQQPDNSLIGNEESVENSALKRSSREIQPKDSRITNVQRSSNDKLNSLEYHEGKRHSHESSGAWIFPDEGSKHFMDVMGGCSTEARRYRGSISFSTPELVEERNSELESSANPKNPSGGLVGQAIKVAIMVGFGTLVFLTRERKNR